MAIHTPSEASHNGTVLNAVHHAPEPVRSHQFVDDGHLAASRGEPLGIKGWPQRLLSLLFPKRCAICGEVLEDWEEGICLRCLIALPHTDYHLVPDNPVWEMLWGWLAAERATSYLFFIKEGKTQRLVHQMKYYGRKDLCRLMGRMMGRDLSKVQFFEGIDALVPVPMYKSKERARGYNQAIELARGLTEVTGLELVTDAVQKTCKTPSQTRGDMAKRWENVSGAFSVVRPERIAGKHVLVVDDVLTTGATMIACSCSMLQVEGVKVSALTLSVTKNNTSRSKGMEEFSAPAVSRVPRSVDPLKKGGMKQ